jgi:glutamate decarboxylase
LEGRGPPPQQQLGRRHDRPNVVCGPVQICWHRFARYFDVEMRQVPLEPGRLVMAPARALELCDENTIGVVPTLGVTSTLQYEPVEALARALDGLQKSRGLDIPLHVDAASGGFVAPFVQPELVWDFRLPRVKSINTSGHKFGLTPLGCGWAVWREQSDLPDELVFRTDHQGSEMSTFALNFSRPAGAVVVQYYNFLRLGWEGYRKIHLGCAETAAYLAVELARMGPFEVLSNGHGGLPGVVWTLRRNRAVPFTLHDLSARLRTRGWEVPAYCLPQQLQDIVVQRALIRHGISRGLAHRLLTAIGQAVRELERLPPTKVEGRARPH